MWVVFASLAAVFFGVRGILYHKASQKKLDYNLFLFGVYFTGALVSIGCAIALRQTWTAAVLLGIWIGFLSFTGNGAMYKGFAVGKASMVALLTGLPALVSASGAYLLWGEKLNNWQLAAFVVIITGILLIRFSGEMLSGNLKGIQWGLIALLFFGLNDISSKYALLIHASIFPLLFLTFGTGSALFCLLWLKNKRRAASFYPPVQPERPTEISAAVTFAGGMAVGVTNIGGMICMLLALSTGLTGLVTAISSANVLIIVLYAKLFLGERFNRREWAGVALTFSGLLILHLTRWLFSQ